MKTDDGGERFSIRDQPTPGRAKRAGRKVSMSTDWADRRLYEMERVLRAKFTQNPDLMVSLRETTGRELIEGNSWGDTFWGVSAGVGENHLGRLLMKIRDEGDIP